MRLLRPIHFVVVVQCYSLALFAASTSTSKIEIKPPERAQLKVSIDLSSESNLKSSNQSDYQSASIMSIGITQPLSHNRKLTARTGFNQDHVGEKETSVANSEIIFGKRNFEFKNKENIESSMRIILPTNEKDRVEATLRGGVGADAFWNSSNYTILRQSGSAQVFVSGLKNIHKYTQSAGLDFNLSHRARIGVVLEQAIAKRWTLELYQYYQLGWTYENAKRATFMLSQTLNYEYDESTRVYLAHANRAAATGANGVDSNVSLYDINTSLFTVGVNLNF